MSATWLAHVLALDELFASPGVSHVLNCGYGRGHSVLEVLEMVAQAAGRPIPHVFGPVDLAISIEWLQTTDV
jgi:UDP-glucose 4-epimerase